MATTVEASSVPCQDESQHVCRPPQWREEPQSRADDLLVREGEDRCGRRLIAHTVDELAVQEPDRIWATVSVGQDISTGFRDITTKQLANCVNGVAHWLEQKIGQSQNFEVIAYLGQSDVRYAILFFAAIKCGYVFMIPSVRNAEAGHLHVLREAKCSKLFHSAEFGNTAKRLKEKVPELTTFELRSLGELLESSSKHFYYNNTWEESWKDPIIIAHSSGSTGFPKSITITNGVLSVYDSLRYIPKVAGRRNQDNSMFNFPGGGRFYNPYPPFHLAGLFAMTYVPIFYNSTVLMGPIDKPPTGQMLSDILRATKVRAAWCPPTVIEQLLEIPGGFEQAAGLDFIMYTGGPLAPAAGDKLSQVTDICQLYGSTESGTQVTLITTREAWQYFEWHPYLANEMDPLGDGTYEMVIHKNPDLLWFRQIYHTFPQLDTYRTNDLFIQHPENPHLWKFHGRRDDVIVLSNGEKFNPVIMEGIISGSPLLHGALIIGMARSQAALIVEPKPNHGLSREDIIRDIWPIVQKANIEGPAHGRIFPSKIIVADPQKPFIRAGKGTIIRRHNFQQFEAEIEAIYSEGETSRRKVSLLELPYSATAIRNFIRDYVSDSLPDIKDLADDDDLFNAGLDSLQTTEFASQIKAWIKTNQEAAQRVEVSSRLIYEHPSIQKLASHLDECLNAKKIFDQDRNQGLAKRRARMSALVAKFSRNISPNIEVILTGSTGSLGIHLLKALLQDPAISRINCLNRAINARDRCWEVFQEHGAEYLLTAEPSRVRFITVDFGHTHFGIADETYTELLQATDFIIHNAWAVNFNHQLQSFENVHIQGVSNFVDFCRRSARKTHLLFVSSVSAVQNWNTIYGNLPVPETVVDDYAVALDMGYGESKHVSEKILHFAATSGINASVLRIGQIAGPVSYNAGSWNETEWFPALIKTSRNLGIIPDTLGSIDWIPVDKLATIIVDLIHNIHKTGKPRTFNLVNPRKASWKTLLPAVMERWNLRPVPFTEWVAALEIKLPDASSFGTLPALKLLDFFVDMCEDLKASQNRQLDFVTDNGTAASETMAQMGAIDADSLRIWLDQWKL